jgi:hypothetical protein
MRNDHATDLSRECYVVEVDGIAKAKYPIFVNALRASLQLRQELPNCRIKLRDAVDETTHDFTSLSPSLGRLWPLREP